MPHCYVWTAQGIKQVLLAGSARVWPHPILELSERDQHIRFRRTQGQSERDQHIRFRRTQGQSVAQIATAVGLSRQQIYNILKD